MRYMMLVALLALAGCGGGSGLSEPPVEYDMHATKPVGVVPNNTMSLDTVVEVFRRVRDCVGAVPTAEVRVHFTEDKPAHDGKEYSGRILYGDPHMVYVWSGNDRKAIVSTLSHEFVHLFLYESGYDADTAIQSHEGPGGELLYDPIFLRCRVHSRDL